MNRHVCQPACKSIENLRVYESLTTTAECVQSHIGTFKDSSKSKLLILMYDLNKILLLGCFTCKKLYSLGN